MVTGSINSGCWARPVVGKQCWILTYPKIASGLIYNVCSSFCSTFSPKYHQNKSESSNREFIIVPFNCKFIDNLNLKSIFSDTSVIDLLPILIQSFTPLQIYYEYNDPISLSICNYASFLKKLYISDIKSILDSPCDCHSSPFNYPPHGHVVTGNLVLFPASLTHFTIPFESKEDRIVLAFDVIAK